MIRSEKHSGFRRRGLTFTGILLVLLLVAAACGSSESSDPTTQTTGGGGTETTVDSGPSTDSTGTPDPGQSDDRPVTIAWSESITTIDVGRSSSAVDVITLENVYDHITDRGPTGDAEPSLVTDWEYNEDATEVTLHVREGVLFHNGEEMTAVDVAYSLNRLIDPEYEGEFFRPDHQAISSVEVVDDYTVLVKFSTPSPNWIQITPTRTPIIPASLGEELGNDFGLTPETTVATGPYKVREFVRDDRLVLEAFEDYWRGTPAIGEVVVRGVIDEGARVAALLAGDVDIAHNVAIDQVEVVEGDPGLEIREVSSIARNQMTFNSHSRGDTPLADVRVREALAIAIDWQGIIDNVLDGYGELTATTVLPFEKGFNAELELHQYDPERARELLDEAGYPDGIQDLVFIVRTSVPKAEDVGQVIQAMWEEVGVTSELTLLEGGDFTARMESDDLDVALYTHRAGTAFHAGHAMRDVFGCDLAHVFYGRKYCNDELSALLAEGLVVQTTDPEAADEIYREAQRVLWEDFAIGGVWAQPYLFGVNADLNWEPNAEGDNWMFAASWK